MNNHQRKNLNEALELIERAIAIIADIKEQEGEKYDNMPDGLTESPNAVKFDDNAATLEEIEWDLDSVKDDLSAFIAEC